jgi:hypothetical protein
MLVPDPPSKMARPFWFSSVAAKAATLLIVAQARDLFLRVIEFFQRFHDGIASFPGKMMRVARNGRERGPYHLQIFIKGLYSH